MMTFAMFSSWKPHVRSHVFSCLLVLGVASSTRAVDQVPWVADLATAQRIAASRNQLVLLHFTADNCPPCRRIEENIFSDAIFGRSVAEAYVPVKVNVTLNPSLAEQYRVKAWPTDILIAPDGREVHRMISQQDKNQYITSLRQVAWAYQSQPGNTSLAAMRTGDQGTWPPAQAGTADLAASMTPSAGAQPFAPQYQNTIAAVPPGMPPVNSTAPSGPPLEMDNTYVQGASYAVAQQSTAPPATPAGASPAYAPASGVAQPSATPPAMPSYSPQIAQNPPGAPSYPAHVQTAANVTPGSDAYSAANAQASYAPSTPPTQVPAVPSPPDLSTKPALDGFCPVAVMDEDRWATGDSRWGARHRGRVYLFHSAASQQRFLSDPERYSPALAGFDPVLFAEQGQFIEGKREHGLRFENQMFLFQSEASLARFEQNPDQYSGYVRQAVAGNNVQR